MKYFVKDWRGNPIRLGSRVVWPSRQSSSMWMNEGVVEKIEPDGEDLRGDPIFKIGVRKIREGALGRYGAVKVKATNSPVRFVSAERVTAVGFFTAGDDWNQVIGASSTERMVAS